MKISEIFYSVQGEGSLVGVPSIFIRTSGCNLRCQWCDTPYTSWAPEGEDLAVGEILQRAAAFPASHVVVTGGEPMMAPQIVELTAGLRERDLHITIETAGTIYAPVLCNLMSISPKLANSTPVAREGGRWRAQHDRLRYQPAILRRLMTEYRYQLKFVLSAESDLDEIESICKELNTDQQHVILMAEGTDSDTLRQRGLWLTEVCKQKGYRFSPRLHIDLWGMKRGV